MQEPARESIMAYLANIISESLLLAQHKEFGSAAAGGFYYKVVLCLFKLELVQSNPPSFLPCNTNCLKDLLCMIAFTD